MYSDLTILLTMSLAYKVVNIIFGEGEEVDSVESIGMYRYSLELPQTDSSRAIEPAAQLTDNTDCIIRADHINRLLFLDNLLQSLIQHVSRISLIFLRVFILY